MVPFQMQARYGRMEQEIIWASKKISPTVNANRQIPVAEAMLIVWRMCKSVTRYTILRKVPGSIQGQPGEKRLQSVYRLCY